MIDLIKPLQEDGRQTLTFGGAINEVHFLLHVSIMQHTQIETLNESLLYF
ncbi:hypothetical protein N8683_03235 [bacterium]|nr:hypothetical protein [bacterium]